MKTIHFFKSFLTVAFFALFITSCTDDGSGTTDPTVIKPKADFIAGTGILVSDATVNVASDFTVNLVANKGDNPMATLTIEDAGAKVSLDRIAIAGLTSFGNPVSLNNDLQSAFDFKITIKAHTDISTKSYKFTIADTKGNTTSKTISITTLGTPPAITEPAPGLKFDIAPNALFTSVFKVTKGTAALKSMEVLINDVKATDLTKIFYGQVLTPIDANPYTLPAGDKDFLNKEIYFRAPAATGTYKYTVKFIDETGLFSSRDITVNVGTQVSMLAGVLLNQAGTGNTGGLDLDTGASTGTVASNPTSASAEIRDEGIVDNQNDPTWKQQISGMNGSVIKYITKGVNGVAETYKFENIKFQEEISGLWSNGVAFNKRSTDNLRDISAKVVVGDNFIVKKDDKYYLLSVKEVKVTTTDNKDQYTFDVKF